MKILKNIKLAPYTTFKIGGEARYFCEARDQFDALAAFEFAKEKKVPVFLLGGGSNVLVSDEGFKGLVMRIVNKGIEIISESQHQVLLKVASGEVWDDVVSFAVGNNWWGMENLSHIPGSTGAIAVQNVGAYGQEAKNLIELVTIFDTVDHTIKNIELPECEFGYRRSIFNKKEKGRYIIFYITFRLSKLANPILEYRDLYAKFKGQKKPLIDEIRKEIIKIRDMKYPFPVKAKNGNAGSFFKNPIINAGQFNVLKAVLGSNFGPETAEKLQSRVFITSHSSSFRGEEYKVPAAFLLEICGLKDVQVGGAKINHNQPLIVLNETGKATAKDVLSLAKKVLLAVYAKIGVKLLPEPELVGFSKKDLENLYI